MQDAEDAGPDAGGAPLWVKVSAAIALALVVLLLVLHLAGLSPGGPAP